MQKMKPYQQLAISLVISFFIMYAVMFVNVDDSSHIYFSLTRSYMSLLMVSPMAIVMMLTMKHMFPNKRKNRAIISSALICFVVALVLLRTQTPIADIQYMKAMIPHHSSAIMTSKHAQISDSAVKKLSLSIIESQQREIAEMKQILKRMQQ